MTIPLGNQFVKALSLDGAGAVFDSAVDGSTPKRFLIAPGLGESYILTRMNTQVIAGNFNDQTKYGGLALTNGMTIAVEDKEGNVITDYTEDFPIIKNQDWAFLAGVDTPLSDTPINESLVIRWTFKNSFTDNIVLNGDKEEKLVLTINDNMSGLTYQGHALNGYKINNITESNLK